MKVGCFAYFQLRYFPKGYLPSSVPLPLHHVYYDMLEYRLAGPIDSSSIQEPEFIMFTESRGSLLRITSGAIRLEITLLPISAVEPGRKPSRRPAGFNLVDSKMCEGTDFFLFFRNKLKAQNK